jgi:hypothetical protein
VEFCMETDNKHTYKLYTKLLSYIKNYKHDGSAKDWKLYRINVT